MGFAVLRVCDMRLQSTVHSEDESNSEKLLDQIPSAGPSRRVEGRLSGSEDKFITWLFLFISLVEGLLAGIRGGRQATEANVEKGWRFTYLEFNLF